jgi:hypothetical protein
MPLFAASPSAVAAAFLLALGCHIRRFSLSFLTQRLGEPAFKFKRPQGIHSFILYLPFPSFHSHRSFSPRQFGFMFGFYYFGF